MAGATLTTAANVILTKLQGKYVDAVYYNHELFKWFPEPVMSNSNAYTWNVKSAGKTPAVFSEGGAMPAAGNITWQQPTVSPLYVWCPIMFSGHLQDAVANGAVEVDAIAAEFEDAFKGIADLYTTSFLGGTYGLELAIDSSSNYAGITRSASTWWQSTETTVSTTLNLTHMTDLIETMEDNDIGSKIRSNTNPSEQGIFLVPRNQYSNYGYIAGQKGMQVFDPTDPAQHFEALSCMGIPLIWIGDLTNTTILALDRSAGNFHVAQFRPLRMKFHSNVGDNEIHYMSEGRVLVCRNPLVQGKLGSVTA